MPLGFQPRDVIEMFMRGYSDHALPTLSDVEQNVAAMLVGPFASLQPHLNEIVHEILRRLDVRIGAASVLESQTNHEPWLDDGMRSSRWLWPCLLGYLRDHDQLPPSVLAELD